MLTHIVIILGLAVAVLFVCLRLRIPTIVGFLLTGVLVGPSGLGLVRDLQEVQSLAEIGVVFLLFTLGIEFSLKRLARLKRAALLGGTLQMLLTILFVVLVLTRTEFGFRPAIFLGILISLSSTAIVLRTLQERALVDTPHGGLTLAILIFQDVAVVPLMLLIPLLAGETELHGKALLLLLAKGIGIVAFVLVAAQWVVPRLLYAIARTKSPELFMLSIVAICLSVAGLTANLGLSLALGAFLAGLIISESEYSFQALSNIYPFRDVFTSFFFISVGMLLNLQFAKSHLAFIVLLALLAILLKAVLAAVSAALIGYSLRSSLQAGLALGQVGEFSFILSGVGLSYGLFPKNAFGYFLAVSLLTLALTPWIISLSSRVADRAAALPLADRLFKKLWLDSELGVGERKSLQGHLIAIGYGMNGRNVTRAARIAGIQYVILEMNARTVREERAKGEPILYGDATQEAVLVHAGIRGARVAVIAISDPVATRRVCANLRRLNPKIQIIARTRYLQEVKPLAELGADEVIPEEFETSVEIFVRVLRKYLIPDQEIEKFVAELRSDNYEMLRGLPKNEPALSDLRLALPDFEIANLRLASGAFADGKSLAQMALRKKYGVTVLAIRRGSMIVSSPDPEAVLKGQDLVTMLGQPANLASVLGLFTQPAVPEPGGKS